MLYYCKRCGRLVLNFTNDNNKLCDYCRHTLQPVPIEYTLDGNGRSINNELKEQFINEYVKSSPEFDQYLFDHRDEDLAQRQAKRSADMARANVYAKGYNVNTPTVTCPYCQSTNTKKISGASRWLSVGMFGMGSKKIGKQWHCNKCGSDF